MCLVSFSPDMFVPHPFDGVYCNVVQCCCTESTIDDIDDGIVDNEAIEFPFGDSIIQICVDGDLNKLHQLLKPFLSHQVRKSNE